MTDKAVTGILLLVVSLSLLSGCEQSRTSGKGMYLPQGDVEKGKQAFVDLECYRCHTVSGEDMPETAGVTPMIRFNLGGEVVRVNTYGDLVTSIVNPTHVVSDRYVASLREAAEKQDIKTPMPDFNDRMTVSQLIDLVAFLDSHYQKVVPTYMDYQYSYETSYRGKN